VNLLYRRRGLHGDSPGILGKASHRGAEQQHEQRNLETCKPNVCKKVVGEARGKRRRSGEHVHRNLVDKRGPEGRLSQLEMTEKRWGNLQCDADTERGLQDGAIGHILTADSRIGTSWECASGVGTSIFCGSFVMLTVRN
jgi:hypothetical protein